MVSAAGAPKPLLMPSPTVPAAAAASPDGPGWVTLAALCVFVTLGVVLARALAPRTLASVNDKLADVLPRSVAAAVGSVLVGTQAVGDGSGAGDGAIDYGHVRTSAEPEGERTPQQDVDPSWPWDAEARGELRSVTKGFVPDADPFDDAAHVGSPRLYAEEEDSEQRL